MRNAASYDDGTKIRSRSHHPTIIEVEEHDLNKLAQAYGAIVITIKPCHSKSQMKVRVERLTVENGGQAVADNVSHDGERVR